jgi:hypothetical protein
MRGALNNRRAIRRIRRSRHPLPSSAYLDRVVPLAASRSHRGCGRFAEALALGHLLAQPSDEPIGDRRLVAARVKRIAPLALAEPAEPLARPRHILRRNLLQQLLMPAVIVELDEAARDALDERFALEDLGIAALGARRPVSPSAVPRSRTTYH